MAHVWEKSYPSGVRWDTPLPPAVRLESLLETAATRWPDRIAIDFYDRTFTYRELHDLAARAAKGLQTIGVRPGVHVGLHLPNTPHFVICFFAVLMAGGRVVNFSPLAAPRELKYQLTDADIQVMITLGLPMLYPCVRIKPCHETSAKLVTEQRLVKQLFHQCRDSLRLLCD